MEVDQTHFNGIHHQSFLLYQAFTRFEVLTWRQAIQALLRRRSLIRLNLLTNDDSPSALESKLNCWCCLAVDVKLILLLVSFFVLTFISVHFDMTLMTLNFTMSQSACFV